MVYFCAISTNKGATHWYLIFLFKRYLMLIRQPLFSPCISSLTGFNKVSAQLSFLVFCVIIFWCSLCKLQFFQSRSCIQWCFWRFPDGLWRYWRGILQCSSPHHQNILVASNCLTNCILFSQGLREAIKNGDAASVRKLLNQVLPCKFDKKLMNYILFCILSWISIYAKILMSAGGGCKLPGQARNVFIAFGISSVHKRKHACRTNIWTWLHEYSCIFLFICNSYLFQHFLQAAVFNQTDIVFILMDAGASLEYKNAQGKPFLFIGFTAIHSVVIIVGLIWLFCYSGETPLDCAPATLQYKMRTKMEESKSTDVQNIWSACHESFCLSNNTFWILLYNAKECFFFVFSFAMTWLWHEREEHEGSPLHLLNCSLYS